MHQNWQLTPDKIEVVRRFVRWHRGNAEVVRREALNLSLDKARVKRWRFWRELVIAINTTQSRSGPGSPVDVLTNTKPFPLRFADCAAVTDVEEFVAGVLGEYGFRFGPMNARFLDENFNKLTEDGGSFWKLVRPALDRLCRNQDRDTERKTARLLQGARGGFKGLGPKQSRNVLQGLGLTRSEIPIDSRVVKWLKRFGFPVEYALGNERGYCRVMDDIQELCEACGVWPCVLDAAIFSAHDCRKSAAPCR